MATRENLVTEGDANRLREAWLFASRTRSAMTLWMSKTTDVLPGTREQLEGVARLMGYPPGSANPLERTTCASPAGLATSSSESSTGSSRVLRRRPASGAGATPSHCRVDDEGNGLVPPGLWWH